MVSVTDTAAPDTTRPSDPLDLAALRRVAETAEADTYFPQLGKPTDMNPWTILSLLDRIEELERHNRRLLEIIEEDQPHGLG